MWRHYDPTVVGLVTPTDTVVIGATAMAGAEKFRVVGDSRIEGTLVVTTAAYIGTTGPLYDEIFRVAKVYNADNTQHETATITTDVSGAAVATGLFIGDDGILNLFGTADYSSALAYSRGAYIAYYATGGAAGPALLVGDYAQASLGDPTGGTNPAAVPNVPAVYVRSSQFAFGLCGRASATMATNFYVFPPLASDALHTVVSLSGAYVDNQGATGITNAIAYDAAVQSGASASNLFMRASNPARFVNVAASPATPPAGSIDQYGEAGVLKAKDSAGFVTVIAT